MTGMAGKGAAAHRLRDEVASGCFLQNEEASFATSDPLTLKTPMTSCEDLSPVWQLGRRSEHAHR